jgi:hypothetical protein
LPAARLPPNIENLLILCQIPPAKLAADTRGMPRLSARLELLRSFRKSLPTPGALFAARRVALTAAEDAADENGEVRQERIDAKRTDKVFGVPENALQRNLAPKNRAIAGRAHRAACFCVADLAVQFAIVDGG